METELLKSINSVRRDNFRAKQELKVLYKHKLDKLKNEM